MRNVYDDITTDLAEPNPYVPMTEEEMLTRLKMSRETGKYKEADNVVSDMRLKYNL